MSLETTLVEFLPLISKPMDLYAYPAFIGAGFAAIYAMNPDLRPMYHNALGSLTGAVQLDSLDLDIGTGTGSKETYNEDELEEKVEKVAEEEEVTIGKEQLMKEIGMIENLARGIGKEEERMKGSQSEDLLMYAKAAAAGSLATTGIVLWKLVL